MCTGHLPGAEADPILGFDVLGPPTTQISETSRDYLKAFSGTFVNWPESRQKLHP